MPIISTTPHHPAGRRASLENGDTVCALPARLENAYGGVEMTVLMRWRMLVVGRYMVYSEGGWTGAIMNVWR